MLRPKFRADGILGWVILRTIIDGDIFSSQPTYHSIFIFIFSSHVCIACYPIGQTVKAGLCFKEAVAVSIFFLIPPKQPNR